MKRAYRILITGHDPDVSTFLGRTLSDAGYTLLAIKEGESLLEAVRQSAPDLVLIVPPCDAPDPFAAGRALHECEATAAIPIVFVTETSQAEQVVRAFPAQACDYVVKPLSAPEVLVRVGVQLRLHEAERELRLRNADLEKTTAELANLSRKDPVTHLLNRHSWEELVVQQQAIFERYGRPYSVIMIDVDHFRAYNDECGRRAGNDCISRIANAISDTCRKVDFVGRYGGDQFVVLSPETDGEKALKLADRIHRAVWALGIPHAATTGLARATVSVGVAVCGPAGWEDVLKRADAAVLVAKRAGRNMVYSDQAISADPAQAPAGSPESQTQTDQQPSIQILVVDDDPTNRAVCRGCLQRGGYQVREAADGYIALEEIQKSPPDVIIMDVMMPNMDGLECTRTLRADPDTRDIPIIIVSALSRTEDILAGLQAGADEYISKPIRASELMVRVQSMARLHRERADLLHSYEQRGRQMRLLTRLVEFCRAVGLCDQIEDVLQHTVTTLSDVVECGRVSIMLPDEDEKSLRIVSATGMDKSLADTVVVPVGTTIAGRVFASGHPTVVNTQAEAAANSGDYQAPYFASVPLISAPLDAAGRVVGVLNATDKRGSLPFESRDLEYIELISKVAGTAVHDIRMREAREKASDSIMVALASLAECRDNDTGRHLERVTKFCLLLAEALQHTDEYRGQIDADFLYKLERSAPLHDIGKVGIPDSILLYPGRLNPEQMAVMRTHSTVGARTIESLISRAPGVCFLEMARDIAAHHHERFDGTGYPDGLAGKSIPLAARITAVVDVYDALTSRRVYKEACSHDKAVTIILEGSGTAFDPDIIEAFIQQEKTFADLARTLADAGEPEFRAQPQPALSPG